MNDWECVKEGEWYKDQVRLYNHLYNLSKIALKELDFLDKTGGEKDIILSHEEVEKRWDRVKEVRAIFKKLDPRYTQVK